MARAITDAERDDVSVSSALKAALQEEGRDLGRRARRDLTGDLGPSALRHAASGALEEAGFEPRRDPSGVTLANRPFDSLARDSTELACGMNLDLMKGFLQASKELSWTPRSTPLRGDAV